MRHVHTPVNLLALIIVTFVLNSNRTYTRHTANSNKSSELCLSKSLPLLRIAAEHRWHLNQYLKQCMTLCYTPISSSLFQPMDLKDHLNINQVDGQAPTMSKAMLSSILNTMELISP